MEIDRWPGFRKLLLVTVLSCSTALEVSMPQAEYEVARGDDITLTCSFIPATRPFPLLILTWDALPDMNSDKTIPVGTFYSTGEVVNIAPQYEGRAVLTTDLARQESSLVLQRVTVEDSRSYQCSVNIPNDDEGTTVAAASLLVLVAPSKPICELQGSAEYWHDIVLTCVSEEGSPTPVYAWQSFSINNLPRRFPPKTTEKDGTLSLFNISMETSGFYVCSSTNRIGSNSCNFTLSVMPPSMNVGATAGIIGGVLAAILLLGLIIYCCCRKKNKDAPGSPDAVEYHDKPTSTGKGQYLDEEKPNSQMEPHIEMVHQTEDRREKDGRQQDIETKVGTADHRDTYKDDQYSYNSRKESYGANSSDVDSQRARYGGSRDHLDNQRDRYSGSRDRLDDRSERYGGSRDRLDDGRDRYGGSRDRLDDGRDRYGGSRDRLDDGRERYGGSRDRLDDGRERYSGSRDRLDDQRDRYSGSRDRLDDRHDRHGGSRDHIDL